MTLIGGVTRPGSSCTEVGLAASVLLTVVGFGNALVDLGLAALEVVLPMGDWSIVEVSTGLLLALAVFFVWGLFASFEDP